MKKKQPEQIIITAKEIAAAVMELDGMGPIKQMLIANKIKKHQPVILQVFVEIGKDIGSLRGTAISTLAALMNLLWLIIEKHPPLKHQKITVTDFKAAADQQFAFMKYLDGEQDSSEFSSVTDAWFDDLPQKILFSYFFNEVMREENLPLPLWKRSQIINSLSPVFICIDDVLNSPQA